MEIVPYESKYRQAFIDLNMSWLKKYFTPEEGDFAMLYGIDGIIENGGMAFFAVDESGEAVSTVLLCLIRKTAGKYASSQPTNAVKAEA